MSKVMKIMAVLLMAALIVTAASSVVFAREINIQSFDQYSDTSGAAGSTSRIIGALINIIQIIGTGVAIIMLVALAIKYISAAPGDKAEIKKHAVVYVVGAIVLFAASGILEIIQRFSSNIHKD